MAAEPLTGDDRSPRPAGSGLARGTDRHPDLDEAFAADERFVRLRTRGRRSGEWRTVTVGFADAERDDGSIVVAAGAPETAWASNLIADPSLEVTLRGRTFAARAELLDDRDPRRGHAVRDLILRYGTPSEGLGSGPVFVIRPLDPIS